MKNFEKEKIFSALKVYYPDVHLEEGMDFSKSFTEAEIAAALVKNYTYEFFQYFCNNIEKFDSAEVLEAIKPVLIRFYRNIEYDIPVICGLSSCSKMLLKFVVFDLMLLGNKYATAGLMTTIGDCKNLYINATKVIRNPNCSKSMANVMRAILSWRTEDVFESVYSLDEGNVGKEFFEDSVQNFEELFEDTLDQDEKNGFTNVSSHLVYLNLISNETTSFALKLRVLATLEEHLDTLLIPFREEDCYYEAKEKLEWITLYTESPLIQAKAQVILDALP